MNFPKNLRSLLLLGLIACIGFWSCKSRSGKPKVLVFSKTAGYYHASIPQGVAAIQKLGAENDFEVDTTTQSEMFTEENLEQYSAVIFLSTTGDVLNNYQEADFERYIQAGGGFMGIHAAADTEYDWGWYARLVGGNFADHPGINDPNPNVQAGEITVVDTSHPSTSFLPSPWARTDEWYSYKNMNPEVNVLLNLDEASYKGGMDMGDHPIAWYHDYDGGRAFYTGGGHTDESYTEELYLKHVLAGIQYAIGSNSELDYSKAKSKRVPEENRFTKTSLVGAEFTEPTEMTILPNLDILVAQRRGEILFFNNETEELTEVAKFDVYWKTDARGVNAEEGLLGIQKDPNYSENGYVFVYYSPTGDEEINRLSRFTFKNNTWDMNSEVVVLEVHSDRDICCHTGGSIAFDKEGNLYLSLGDNSTPFNQPNSEFRNNGFAPLDQRPGFEQYDARRSSGDANDLRGKILRIKVNEDGSYDIPEGNLYPEGTEGARPEIYIQGNRNPYRISIDQKNGFLYWGEVGPDANDDSFETRGPRGYDELNQARKAGNFGWPYFVGNNYAYREYDYETGESGAAFDPNGPTNTSVNNTGRKDLPALAPAFIWYPYGESKEFPQLGTGGRNAMAGPVYYSDMYSADTKFPDYYDSKVFIYDWIRGWIKAVTLKENGDYDKMEAFMPSTKFNAIIDMEMGPDGRMYVLEYGNGWFAKNPDAGLSRIDFNGGNRAPIVSQISADKTSGTNPLTVTFTTESSDPENDPLTYTWDLGNGETKSTDVPTLTHTFETIGEYEVKVTAKDPDGLTGTSNVKSVYSGNVAPEVSIAINGNQSFYFPGKKVDYTVTVTDADNPEASSDLSTLYVSADYIEGLDQAESDMGHKVMTEAMMGKSLFTTLTCKTCHKEAEASVGPAYIDVAKKYNQRDADYLKNKIKNGGAGVWGEVAMPANPDMKESDLNALVAYILSLDQVTTPSLPASGSVDATAGKEPTPSGVLMLNASYTDQGGENIKPLSGSSTLLLKSNSIDLGGAEEFTGGFSIRAFNGATFLSVPNEEGSVLIGNMDLTDVGSVTINTFTMGALADQYEFQIRLDSPTGELAGEVSYSPKPSEGRTPNQEELTIPFSGSADGKMHKVYLISKPNTEGSEGRFSIRSFTFNSK